MLKSRSSTISSDSSQGEHKSSSLYQWRDAIDDINVEPAMLVLQDRVSARSIVFRDHARRLAEQQELPMDVARQRTAMDEYITELQDAHRSPYSQEGDNNHQEDDTVSSVRADAGSERFNVITVQQGTKPIVRPLPNLKLTKDDIFEPLLAQPREEDWTVAEKEVVEMLRTQHAVIKTIRNTDWTSFLNRFRRSLERTNQDHFLPQHLDIPPEQGYPFNSFVTSTSMLPPLGKKMRAFGSTAQFTTGVVFALPTSFGPGETEDEAVCRTETWAWPSGYSAKTEFNIDDHGQLINGRKEALLPLSVLRQYNLDYISKQDYIIGQKLLKGGLNQVPYNEIFARVGGLGRLEKNDATMQKDDCIHEMCHRRSFDRGLGLPVALFVRSATYGHLISLLRTRARIIHVLGEQHIHGIPLLLITPEDGLRVLTEALQEQLLITAARNLNPFQNNTIAYKTTINDTPNEHFEQKLEELLDLDDSIRHILTPEECVRLAGGFGATDDSIANILTEVMRSDVYYHQHPGIAGDFHQGHHLQDLVNEGLAAAVRAGDYHTSRQLLLMYSLVAAQAQQLDESGVVVKEADSTAATVDRSSISRRRSSLLTAPPLPPLDTDRLRSATNSDGLLAVLGAAEILKAIQNRTAGRRAMESILAVEEWVEHGEQSMSFRLASWRNAGDDYQHFMSFLSNKATNNRKLFAKQLRLTMEQSNANGGIGFLIGIQGILVHLQTPGLRLELLQYILGLDSRYSVAHVERSIELAATCLSIASSSYRNSRDERNKRHKDQDIHRHLSI